MTDEGENGCWGQSGKREGRRGVKQSGGETSSHKKCGKSERGGSEK